MTHDRLNVCLIDDDKIYQFTARKIIESTGHAEKILAFPNGKEALAYIQTHVAESESIPDVIFLDIHMPVMNGWQFLEGYTSIAPRIPKPVTIFMVSSSLDDEDINRSKSTGVVSDYIVKPIARDNFISLLDTLAKG